MAIDPSHHKRSTPYRLRGLTAVAAGGIIGSAARAGISQWLGVSPNGLPVATLVVNLTGSFLLGIYLVRREHAVGGPWALRFWAFGAFGSFTTFSAFSLETVTLVANGQATSALVYVAGSVLGGLLAALLGQRLMEAVL